MSLLLFLLTLTHTREWVTACAKTAMNTRQQKKRAEQYQALTTLVELACHHYDEESKRVQARHPLLRGRTNILLSQQEQRQHCRLK